MISCDFPRIGGAGMRGDACPDSHDGRSCSGAKEGAWAGGPVYLSAIVEGATSIRPLRANSPPTPDRCWESA